MFTLLPELHKRDLYREYRVRLLTVLFCMVSIVVFVNILLFIPLYISVSGEEKRLRIEGDVLNMVIEDKNKKDINETLDAIRYTTNILSKEKKTNVFGALKTSISYLPTDVNLTSITYIGDLGGEGTLTLEGISATRKSVIAFSNSLKSNKMFTLVDLPISDLAKEFDVKFHITTRGNF